MPLHPDAPDDVRGDPEKYARWRLDHKDDEERAALVEHCHDLGDWLKYFRDEWYEAMDQSEDAEIERDIERGRGKKEH